MPRPASSPAPSHGPPGSARFPRAARLAHAREFQAVYAARAKKIAGPLIVWGMPSPAGRWRLGLSVGKRIGNAVARNRAKRLVREAFRLLRADFDLLATDGRPPLDLVVSVRAPAVRRAKHAPIASAAPPPPALTLHEVQHHLLDAAQRIHKEWIKRDDRAARRHGTQEHAREHPER